MKRPGRSVGVFGAAVGAALLALLARPALEDAWARIRRSSSPSVRAYEALASLLLGGYYRDVSEDCTRAVAAIGSPAVLEVGPGPGHLAERILAVLPGARMVVVDIDPAMLAACRRRLAGAGLADRATFVEGDVAGMALAEASFDLVVTSFSAHHWQDPARGFREIRRVLRPGGTALVYDLPEWWGHLESRTRGIGAAGEVFERPTTVRFRGIGPVTIVSRVELRRPIE